MSILVLIYFFLGYPSCDRSISFFIMGVSKLSGEVDRYECDCGYAVISEDRPGNCPECGEHRWGLDVAFALERQRRGGTQIWPPKISPEVTVPDTAPLDGTLLDDLQAVRSRYKETLDEVRREVHESVTKRRISGVRMISPEPLFSEVDRSHSMPWWWVQREWLVEGESADEPKEHGFDEQGRLRTLNDDLLIYGDGWIDEVHPFASTAEVDVMLTRHVLNEDGETVRTFEVLNGGCNYLEYVYANGRLIISIERRPDRDDGKWVEDNGLVWYEYEYDDDALLNRVLRNDLRENCSFFSSVWFIRPRGESVQTAAATLKAALAEAFPDVLRRSSRDEAICALWIEYCGEDITCGYPGDFFIVLDATRRKLLAEDRRNASCNFWRSGIEVGCERALRMSIDEAALRLIQQSYRESDGAFIDADVLRSALHASCRGLNSQPITQSANVTDDFIFCCVDSTGEYDEEEDLSACLTETQYQRAREMGVVG